MAGGGEVEERDDEVPEPEDLRFREGYRWLASLEPALMCVGMWEGLVVGGIIEVWR